MILGGALARMNEPLKVLKLRGRSLEVATALNQCAGVARPTQLQGRPAMLMPALNVARMVRRSKRWVVLINAARAQCAPQATGAGDSLGQLLKGLATFDNDRNRSSLVVGPMAAQINS